MEEEKKTLGQQYIDKYNCDEKGIETRNIVEEYGNDRFGPMIEKIIHSHRDFASHYYIWIVNQDLPQVDVSTKKINFVVRKSKPTPKWESILYSYDNGKCDLRLEWALPTKEGSEAMLENPRDWDPQLISFIHENLSDLKKQQDQILSMGQIPPEPPGAYPLNPSAL